MIKLTGDETKLLLNSGGVVESVEVVIANKASCLDADMAVDLCHIFYNDPKIAKLGLSIR